MNEKYGIQIQNLRKEFGSKVAVNDININIKEGQLFSMLGVNGAGKTTTIRMLMGLSKPTSGDALVMGHSILTELSAVKQISNFSPQETSVAPNLTVRENLEFFAKIYGADKEKASKLVEEMIEKFSLQEVEKSKAKTLSGGWQRKLSIAMALISSPKVLFLDEPTLGLDVLARRELWSIIEKLKGNMTIVLTTHYMEEAEQLSDEIAIMVNGEIKAHGTLEEMKRITGKDNLEDAFVSIAEGSGKTEV
ncbi:MAG: ATP-binding cassette domain-containing protein [Lachnospiraceae bacterium]|nr:ATP-binding cassette domain-containing protein [Lachnospiraceae bacterium]